MNREQGAFHSSVRDKSIHPKQGLPPWTYGKEVVPSSEIMAITMVDILTGSGLAEGKPLPLRVACGR